MAVTLNPLDPFIKCRLGDVHLRLRTSTLAKLKACETACKAAKLNFNEAVEMCLVDALKEFSRQIEGGDRKEMKKRMSVRSASTVLAGDGHLSDNS